MTIPLRVGLRWPGAPGRRGGVDVYAEGLTAALARHAAGQCAVTAIVPGELASSLPDGVTSAALPPAGAVSPWARRREIARRVFPGARSAFAPMIDGLALDIVHYPATRLEDPGLRTPVVLTFFDMQEEFLPGNFGWRERLARRIVHRDGVRAATLVLAPSAFTADALLRRYGTPAHKVRVVPPGIDPAFRTTPEAGERERLAARYAVPDEYLLYPANAWPHKNHARLFAALAAANPLPPLLCTGRLTKDGGALAAMTAAAGLPPAAVRDLGFVPGQDLGALYRGARGMIFPSLFEGFGLPVLEAMASGCPVACSSLPPLVEVAGDAARFFDPLDAPSIAAALKWLATDSPQLRDAIAHGATRAAAYEWPRVLPGVIAAYRDAAGIASPTAASNTRSAARRRPV